MQATMLVQTMMQTMMQATMLVQTMMQVMMQTTMLVQTIMQMTNDGGVYDKPIIVQGITNGIIIYNNLKMYKL